MKIKILFLIHDLGQGGAEKVLVNLVNNMDTSKFDIHVTALFGGGVNEQFLAPHITYRTVFHRPFPKNSMLMKLFSPVQLHRLCVREMYDIEVSYLEGPSARVISGCENVNTKLVCWIHSNHFSMKQVSASFRNKEEAIACYQKFDQVICVSKFIKENFCSWIPVKDKCSILYNTVDSTYIRRLSEENTPEIVASDTFKLISVGTLKEVKGFDRLLRIVKRLHDDGINIHLYLLGKGPLKKQFEEYVANNKMKEYVSLLGYHTNPYKYVAKSDLFVCSSYSEGFSTAVTEALIVGTPVCTVEVSGMREMLGENNEYGIVTQNNEVALYDNIRKLMKSSELLEHYRKMAIIRGNYFDKESTVRATEQFFLSL